MRITLDPTIAPFNLDYTLQCGQVFRWEKLGDWWCGVVADKAMKVRQINNELEFEGANADFVEKYFRLNDPLPQVLSKISRDEHIKTAIQRFHGLRLIRQDPWECLISYICATYKNIPAIKKTISNLAKKFGDKTTLDDDTFFTFPEPRILANTSAEALKDCKLGFRARNVLETAKHVDSKDLCFSELEGMNYEGARNELLELRGVGEKVADCVLLFSLNRLEAFPLDVWMKKTILKYYSAYFDDVFTRKVLKKKSLTPSEYRRISSFARQYFGEYAGYAQQYLFHYERCLCHAV